VRLPYVLVPRDLYDVLLSALRTPAPTPGYGMTPMPAPPSVPTDAVPPALHSYAAPELSETVVRACRDYGFGEPADVATNLQTARHMKATGASDAAVFARLRDGANLSALEPLFL